MAALVSDARKLMALAFVAYIGAVGAVAAEIPVECDSTAILPAFLTEVATGAPVDSLFLRVSFYNRPGDGRFDAWAYVVVEELQWPLPQREMGVVGDRKAVTDEPEPRLQIVSQASRIDGHLLNDARRRLVTPASPPSMRAGEIGGHWLRPFKFVEWVSPLRFKVTDGRGNFEISRIGRGRFELVTVEGVR